MIAAGLALTAAAVLISWCAGFGRTDTMQVRIGVLAWTANIAAAVVFVVAGAVGLADSGQRLQLGRLGVWVQPA